MLLDMIRGWFNGEAAAEIAPAAPPVVAPPKQPRQTERLVRARFAGVSEDPLDRLRRERAEAHDLVARGAAASASLYTPITPAASRAEMGTRQTALPAGLDRAALSPADAIRLRDIVRRQHNGQHGSTGGRS